MARKDKAKKSKKSVEQAQRQLFSERQKRVLIIVIIAMFIMVPIVDNFRCKASCLKRIKTPYPEIACQFECPWPWERK